MSYRSETTSSGIGRWADVGMMSRRRALAGLLGVGLIVSGGVVGLQAAMAARVAQHNLQAAAVLLAGVEQPTAGSLAARISLLRRAQQDLRNAGSALNEWPLGAAAKVPYLGRDVRLAQALDAGATAMSASGIPMLSAITRLAATGPSASGLLQTSYALAAFAQATRHAAARVRAQQSLLVGERPRQEFLAAADRAELNATNLADGMRLATGFWGPTGSKRYLVVLQNPAELRGTGGLIGEYGVIVATPDGPQLTSLAPFRQFNAALGAGVPTPPTLAAYSTFGVGQDLTDANIPPDFPSVGRLLVSLYRRASGASVQGIIAVDPLALADLLQVTGPITVDGVRLNGGNAASVLLRTSYVHFATDNAARHAFLRQVAQATFLAVRTGMRSHVTALVQALSVASAGRHLQLFFSAKSTEHLATALGLAGSTAAPATGDELAVYSVNTGGNKLDAYLHRTITDNIALSADGASAALITVELQTNVPHAMPKYVVGPFSPGMQPGADLQSLSMLLPATSGYTSATINGRPAVAATAAAFGGEVVTQSVAVFSGQPVTLKYRVTNPQAAQRRGRLLYYNLTALPQATANPDRMTVTVTPPRGWHFVSLPSGFSRRGSSASSNGFSPSLHWTFLAKA